MMQQVRLLIKSQELQDFGYPGGPKVDNLAKQGKANIELPKTHFDNLDFSFSGIKTAVINLNHKNPNINKADLCASFQKTVTEILLTNIEKAIKTTKIRKIVLAGGVSANTYIRDSFLELEKNGIKIYMPDLKLCTDNAAMIASAGYYNYLAGNLSDYTLNAIPNLKLQNSTNEKQLLLMKIMMQKGEILWQYMQYQIYIYLLAIISQWTYLV